MKIELFDINKFNIIQDEENYYFFRALNMADNSDIEKGITTDNESGAIKRIRTDRERYEENPKYTEKSELSLEEIFDHIKMHYRKDTNCISLTSNANIAISYGREYYKDKYVMIKVPKNELGSNTVVAGQYMLQELSKRIESVIEELDDEKKDEILEIFSLIDSAESDKELRELITTIIVHCDKAIKYSNNNGFLLSSI